MIYDHAQVCKHDHKVALLERIVQVHGVCVLCHAFDNECLLSSVLRVER